MEVNEMQIGGDHYRKQYQHWDFVNDTGMHYFLGCATKYISRWRDKNGTEDLRKSIHYLRKAEDREVYMPENKWWENVFSVFLPVTTESSIRNLTYLFCQSLPKTESQIIRLIVGGSYLSAMRMIEDIIISEEAAEPGSGYTHQDPKYFKG